MRHEKQEKMSGGPSTLIPVAPMAVERALKGLDFPASKEEIIAKADENKAPDDVFFALDHLEDRNYSNLNDILLGLS